MQLIKRPQNYSYDELWTPSGKKFDYPETCPCCGAPGKEVEDSWFHQFAYDCGGGWQWKSQIQNHTDKVYGKCGLDAKYAEQERVAMLIIIYNSFCNWTVFPKEIKIENTLKLEQHGPTIKDHVVYKISWSGGNRLQQSMDYVKSYTKWVEENFDKYKPIIDKCLGKENYGKYIDPRLICGFDEDWNPEYVTDWEEVSKRLDEIGFNEYGNLQFYNSRGLGSRSLTKWWKKEVV